MGFRFRRSLRIAPGLRINLSRSGVSTSIGRRGAWFTFGPRGTRETIGVPGSGVYYTAQQQPHPEQAPPPAAAGQRIAAWRKPHAGSDHLGAAPARCGQASSGSPSADRRRPQSAAIERFGAPPAYPCLWPRFAGVACAIGPAAFPPRRRVRRYSAPPSPAVWRFPVPEGCAVRRALELSLCRSLGMRGLVIESASGR